MVFTFLLAALVTTLTLGALHGSNILTLAKQALVDSPLLFFAFVMLTEPLTTPPTKTLQIWYGGLVGFLFAPQVHFAGLYFSPELALVAGNIFSYAVSPKQKLVLTLKQKIKRSADVYDFIFTPAKKMNFKPGQYLEWTLGHKSPDSRGNRRYFTIASAPTETEMLIGLKFYPKPSSFKHSLLNLKPGQQLIAGQLAGDFTMPKNAGTKLVFIAGGIGITPFRSMIKYLLDTRQKRPIILFYANRTPEDIVYKEIFDKAQTELGIKTVYTVTENKNLPDNWQGEMGRINEQMIKTKVPDFKERMFYLSGPRSMVNSFEQILSNLGVPSHNIKTDFFPGLV